MFTDLILNYVKDQALEQVSKKIGIDPSLLKWQWGEDAIWSLVTGLFHNTQKDDWLQNLDDAVTKDHDGSIFDDISKLLTESDEWNKIVGHILGDKQWVVAQLLAQKLNISVEQATTLLWFVAPLVMGALGKKKQETGANAWWLKEIIKDEEKEINKTSQTPSVILQLLDKDGDGDVDLADFLS